jgi:tRNA U38,U39,U40 pseudouridine synthase TruA
VNLSSSTLTRCWHVWTCCNISSLFAVRRQRTVRIYRYHIFRSMHFTWFTNSYSRPTNKCRVLPLCISLLKSFYMFRHKCYNQGADTILLKLRAIKLSTMYISVRTSFAVGLQESDNTMYRTFSVRQGHSMLIRLNDNPESWRKITSSIVSRGNTVQAPFIRTSFSCKFALTAHVSVVPITIYDYLFSAENIHCLRNISRVYFYGRQ